MRIEINKMKIDASFHSPDCLLIYLPVGGEIKEDRLTGTTKVSIQNGGFTDSPHR